MENVWPLVPSIAAQTASVVSFSVRNVSLLCINAAPSMSLRFVTLLFSAECAIENRSHYSIGMKHFSSGFLSSPSAFAFNLVIALELSALIQNDHQTMTLLLLTATEFTKLPSTTAAAREPSQQRFSSFDPPFTQSHL